MKEIQLTKGYVAIVDDEDFGRLSRHKWYAQALKASPVVYAYTRTSRRDGHVCIGMHRMIMGSPPWLRVDHINFNGLDNRRENLRVLEPSLNVAHSRKRAGCSSRYKGVSLDRRTGRWFACIASTEKRRDPRYSKTKPLGYFDREEDAARAYNAAARERFGECAVLNEVPE